MSTADLTIAEAAERLRERDLRAVDLLDDVLTRASETEAQVHAYLAIDHAGARTAAEAADARLDAGDGAPLTGIPLALKDNLVTRGLTTTCASRMLADWTPPYDATVTARLRADDAVIVGKTNLDEFAMGSSTENSAFGPTRNPWDTDRVPGGSSGGSAAAVSIGSALGSYGSDTGGSIRQPASFTGTVGLKPTYGLVSRHGLVAFASSLDQAGPIARSVEDATILLETVIGHDPLDATSWDGPVPDLRAGFGRGVEGLRIGVVEELSGDGTQPGVLERFTDTVDTLVAAGATVERVSLPILAHGVSVYYILGPAEASANLTRFDGIRYGSRVDGETLEAMMARTRADGFGPEVTRRILIGTYALSAGYQDAFYGQAQRVRTKVIDDLAAAYERVDVLVSPTCPTTAFGVGERTEDLLAMYLSDVCTIPANLAGHPAISVPIGTDPGGLPVGMQIMAPAFGEPLVLQVAEAVEAIAGRGGRPDFELVAQ